MLLCRRSKPAVRPMLPPRWRRRPCLSALLVGLFLLAVVDRAGWLHRLGDDRTRYHDKTFRVVKVVDGDTFDIGAPDGSRPSTRVRLWGVDTPEVVDPRYGTMYYGPEASAFAKRMVLGKDVRIELSPARSRDNKRHNRLLAYVYLTESGEMVNELLLTTGHAYADTRFDHVWAERFRELERKAVRGKAGLWANVRPDQFPAWKLRKVDRSQLPRLE